MDTINSYLDNMFESLPQTEEIIRARNELSSMMEDKYTELKNAGKSEHEAIGAVISEFGNVDEVLEEMGINRQNTVAEEAGGNTAYHVSLAEAQCFTELKDKLSGAVAFAVMLCILSPVMLIVLIGLSSSAENGHHVAGYILSDDVSAIIGVCILILMIAAAVIIFIVTDTRLKEFEHYKKDVLILDRAALRYAMEYKEENASFVTACTAIGVAMCIISPIPLLISSVVFRDNGASDWIYCLMTGILLIIVSVGVYLLVYSDSRNEVSQVLLQKEEYTVEDKSSVAVKKTEVLSSIYWPVIVIAYLLWSFISREWGITWVIWPIAAVAFNVIETVIKAKERSKTIE